MQEPFAVPIALPALKELVTEAGKALADKTRDLNSRAVPDYLRAFKTSVGEAIQRFGMFGVSSAADLSSMLGAQMTAAGEFTGGSLKWLGGSVPLQFGLLSKIIAERPTWFTRRGTLEPESEALLQDALVKHDALLREIQSRNAANSERVEYLGRLVLQLTAVIRELGGEHRIDESEFVKVLSMQRAQLDAVSHQVDATTQKSGIFLTNFEAVSVSPFGELEGIAARAEADPGRCGASIASNEICGTLSFAPVLRPWSELLAEAQVQCSQTPTFDDLLTDEEQAMAKLRLATWREEYYALNRLTGFDYAVAGVAGMLAALADIFLVWVPSHPGFLGSPASEGGWLSRLLRERFDALLPEDTVRGLEIAYTVPYDASTNSLLHHAVPGLGPRSHRLHSLGHDPLLGWIFGVRDILSGSFTAVGKDGSLITQVMPDAISEEMATSSLEKLIEAFRLVGGHMLSDVNTPAGLPPPLFVLSQFFQAGNIGGYNISEIAGAMYRSGYDFRHFLAGGTCVGLIEVIVRTAWLSRELYEGRSFADALPCASKPRLRTGLLLAHSVAAAVNAGKIALTQNPLSLNWAQWLALFRYLIPQVHWLLVGQTLQREALVRDRLEKRWAEFDTELVATWRQSFGHAPVVTL